MEKNTVTCKNLNVREIMILLRCGGTFGPGKNINRSSLVAFACSLTLEYM